MRAFKISAAVVLALGVFVSRVASAECTTDVECKGDRICVDGHCVDPPAPKEAAPKEAPPQPVAPVEARPPDPKKADEAQMERRSTPLFVAGVAFVAAAPLALFVGLAGVLNREECEGSWSEDCLGSRHTAMIVGGFVAAPIFGAAGVTMVIIGGKRVPTSKADAMTISPWISRSGGGLGWQGTF